MSEVTKILNAIDAGDPQASERLLPLVYEELRKLASSKMTQERAGQTLQATALVHEAYLRLTNVEKQQNWNGTGHFFAAAAEAMRRILIDRARQKATLKHGGEMQRVELPQEILCGSTKGPDILALDEALRKLEEKQPRRAEVVKLRFFAGLTSKQTASVLGIARSTVEADWVYAKSWLRVEIGTPIG